MSALPDNELDLEKLFLPAWAQEPASAKHYATYEGGGDAGGEGRGDRRGGRRPGPGRREGGPGGPRGRGDFRGDQRGPRREGGRPPGGPRSGGRRDQGREGREMRERREAPAPLPEVELNFVPDEKGVESLARQIKMTGRAYPLFDIARLILQKPERHGVTFSVRKNPEGQPIQPLFACALDETVWLSEDEAVGHVLRQHFGTFYQTERTATEPPKGKYTFVAQCGMSGAILGPPNYHDYQNQLRKLHAERFSRMPFDAFKARVKIVRDEEVVKKWIDEQSWKTEFVCLNMPEPVRLANREAVEQHFREVHKENIIKPVESHTLSGVAARNLRSPGLVRLVRSAWEDQRRFPLQIATVLSQQFASHGLQFFKVNKTVTHVSVARPHYLDLETTPVSEGVKRIVDLINATPKCTRRKIVEALAPAPTVIPVAPSQPAAAPAEGAAPAEAAPAPAAPEPTAEQTAVIADLHWLIHQGHVIEFANGMIETAKKPLPKPPKPEKKPVGQPAADAAVVPTDPAAAEVVSEAAIPAVEPNPESAIAGPEPAGQESEIQPAEETAIGNEAASSAEESAPATGLEQPKA